MSHELGVTQQILDIAIDKGTEAGTKAVRRINLVIGDMSSFISESVQFYFDYLAKDSIAEGAQLAFRHIPIKVRCRNCNNQFHPTQESWNCPVCNKNDVEVIEGKEFFVESIEVE
jgi:hydrogenase nickel incorporation protein HypA/HybF